MRRGSFLDTVWARLIAGVVALVAAGSLAWLNRGLIEDASAGSGDGVATCLAQRLGDVESLLKDGTITSGQAAEFRIRARQLCEQTGAN